MSYIIWEKVQQIIILNANFSVAGDSLLLEVEAAEQNDPTKPSDIAILCY